MVEQPRPQPVAPPVPQTDAADQARRAQEAADQSKRAQAQLEQARKAAAKAEQAKKAQLLAEQAKKEKALAEAKRERQEAQEEARRADEERAAREASEARAAQEQAEREQAAREQAAKALPPVAVAVAQPPAPKPAPVPSGPSRAFSASPVAGGAPPYPAELESDGRSGSVTVACRILEDGHPSGCRVVSARGGEPFKGAVLGWLNSGRVRYEPILHNGKPVVESHQWSVQFQPE
jgi:outer membrane biosynthesis protein TonB